jgi:CHASE3 domain sensor protein
MKTITKNLDFFNVSMAFICALTFLAIYAFYLNTKEIRENFRRPAVVSMTKIK